MNRSDNPVAVAFSGRRPKRRTDPFPLAARCAGFTLAELLVALAVAAILVATAAPNLRAFVQNSRLEGAADEFVAAVQRARSEAITRGSAVILCRTADSSTDNCGTSANEDWSRGWLMYAVPSFNGEEDYGDSADNVLIQRGGPVADGVTVTSDSNGNSWLTMGSDGTLREGGPLAYAFCDERGEEHGRLVVIPMIGRPYITDNMTAAPNCEPA